MYLLFFGFLCFLQFPFFHLHVPPCSSSQAWQTTSLAPGLYLHGGAWMDGTWEPFSMTRCISYTWGLWGISMQVRWDIGSEMVTMGMGRCLKSWGPFPKTSKINPAEKGPLVRFNVIIFGWVPLFIFIWEALQIDVWWDLQNNVCGMVSPIVAPYLILFFWANPQIVKAYLGHQFVCVQIARVPGSFLRARPSHWRTRDWRSQTNTQKLALHSKPHLWKELCGSLPKLP